MAPALGLRVLSRQSYHPSDKSILDGSPAALVVWISTLGGSPPRGGTGTPLLPATAADVNVAPASADPLSFGGGRRAFSRHELEERREHGRVVAGAPGGGQADGGHLAGQLAVDHARPGQRAQRARHQRDAH